MILYISLVGEKGQKEKKKRLFPFDGVLFGKIFSLTVLFERFGAFC